MLLKYFVLSAKFLSAVGASRHSALKGNCPVLHIHILALSTDNPPHNILELYNVLVQVLLATSNMKLDIYCNKLSI